MVMQNMGFINSQYGNNIHANTQLVNSEKYQLKKLSKATFLIFTTCTKTTRTKTEIKNK